jgi:hypothetical protein
MGEMCKVIVGTIIIAQRETTSQMRTIDEPNMEKETKEMKKNRQ